MKNFKPFTKTSKKEVTNPHIKATRATKNKKSSKKTNTKTSSKSYQVFDNGLSTKVSENYEGHVGGIIALINGLPQAVQHFIHNNKLEKTVVRQGYSLYVLEGNITIKITEINFNLKNRLRVVIKEKKNIIVNRII